MLLLGIRTSEGAVVWHATTNVGSLGCLSLERSFSRLIRLDLCLEQCHLLQESQCDLGKQRHN